MTAAPAPDDDNVPQSETESLDSVLVEFSDTDIDFTPRPIRDTVLRHLPVWLREAAERRGRADPKLLNPIALADCLLEQARVLVGLRRYAEAVPKLAEAEQLYQQAGTPAGVADCYHVAAQTHAGLGEPDKAFDYLRREEDLRRRFAA
ncbi:MAG: hypothetical protein JWO38_117 [Gemmataceae bacterium]|nr:hypothetical protein [Gemmataceae bacterium]